jgi:hypothetical protein
MLRLITYQNIPHLSIPTRHLLTNYHSWKCHGIEFLLFFYYPIIVRVVMLIIDAQYKATCWRFTSIHFKFSSELLIRKDMKLAVRSLFFCPNIIHPEMVIRDISWCFRPLFIWMRILGIDLYPISRKSIRRYGLVMLLMGTWAEIELIFDMFRKLLSLKLASSTTSNWNIAIDYINNFCFIVFVSLIIFYVTRNRWQLLWDSILKFESNYCQFNHKWLRKMLFIGFSYPLLVSIKLWWLFIFDWPLLYYTIIHYITRKFVTHSSPFQRFFQTFQTNPPIVNVSQRSRSLPRYCHSVLWYCIALWPGWAHYFTTRFDWTWKGPTRWIRKTSADGNAAWL